MSAPQIVVTVPCSDATPLEPERSALDDGGGSLGPSAVALEPLEKEWLQGAACGHVATLKHLLQQDPTLATRKDFTSGFAALHWAAKHGQEEMVGLLLEAGADVNVRAHGGYTPLHIAALHGHQHLMELLIWTYELGPIHGERTWNRKLACLLLPKNSSQGRRRWGSASDLAEEKPAEGQPPPLPEQGKPPAPVSLPSSYRPVRKFSR